MAMAALSFRPGQGCLLLRQLLIPSRTPHQKTAILMQTLSGWCTPVLMALCQHRCTLDLKTKSCDIRTVLY